MIETSFSQLTEKLNLNKVKSKSMIGFTTRTSIKVLDHNISFLINKLINGKLNIMAKIYKCRFLSGIVRKIFYLENGFN